MKLNPLGKSSIRISEISLGCMSLKGDQLDTDLVIGRALDCGVNFFDTADLYEFGRNEKLLANALQDKRKDVIIATKVGNEWGQGIDGWRWNPTKEYILKAVDASLNRLKTDYIDLYQLHGGTIDDPIDEVIEAFELLKEQGKIREYGISSIRPNVIREYAKRSNIVSVMMQYSLLDRRPEEFCLDLLGNESVSVITRGSLAKGLLAGKSEDSYLYNGAEAVLETQSLLTKLSRALAQSPSQIAASFVLKSPVVASAVIGFRTIAQVDELVENYNGQSLTKSNYKALATLAIPGKYQNHR